MRRLCIVAHGAPMLFGYLIVALGRDREGPDPIEIVVDRRRAEAGAPAVERRRRSAVDRELETRGFVVLDENGAIVEAVEPPPKAGLAAWKAQMLRALEPIEAAWRSLPAPGRSLPAARPSLRRPRVLARARDGLQAARQQSLATFNRARDVLQSTWQALAARPQAPSPDASPSRGARHVRRGRRRLPQRRRTFWMLGGAAAAVAVAALFLALEPPDPSDPVAVPDAGASRPASSSTASSAPASPTPASSAMASGAPTSLTAASSSPATVATVDAPRTTPSAPDGSPARADGTPAAAAAGGASPAVTAAPTSARAVTPETPGPQAARPAPAADRTTPASAPRSAAAPAATREAPAASAPAAARAAARETAAAPPAGSRETPASQHAAAARETPAPRHLTAARSDEPAARAPASVKPAPTGRAEERPTASEADARPNGTPKVELQSDVAGQAAERVITYTARLSDARGRPLVNAEVSLHAWLPDGTDLKARLNSTATPGIYRVIVPVGPRTPSNLRVLVAHGGKRFEVAPQYRTL